MIEKRRYKIPLAGGFVAELHVHTGHLSGFNYVEVEFSDVEGAKKFVPPTWFGREVTDDVRFSYGTLAQARGMDIVREILQCE
jgi:CYTH domain-containing protein